MVLKKKNVERTASSGGLQRADDFWEKLSLMSIKLHFPVGKSKCVIMSYHTIFVVIHFMHVRENYFSKIMFLSTSLQIYFISQKF